MALQYPRLIRRIYHSRPARSSSASEGGKRLRTQPHPAILAEETRPQRGGGATLRHAQAALFSRWARPVRFFLVGQTCTLTQILILAALTALGWLPAVANAVALVSSSQVNFVLSGRFTWGDRRQVTENVTGARPGGAVSIFWRWARFMAGITVTTLLNEGLFILLSRELPVVIAALASSGVIAILNFLMIDRLVFTRARQAKTVAGERTAPPVL